MRIIRALSYGSRYVKCKICECDMWEICGNATRGNMLHCNMYFELPNLENYFIDQDLRFVDRGLYIPLWDGQCGRRNGGNGPRSRRTPERRERTKVKADAGTEGTDQGQGGRRNGGFFASLIHPFAISCCLVEIPFCDGSLSNLSNTP